MLTYDTKSGLVGVMSSGLAANGLTLTSIP